MDTICNVVLRMYMYILYIMHFPQAELSKLPPNDEFEDFFEDVSMCIHFVILSSSCTHSSQLELKCSNIPSGGCC